MTQPITPMVERLARVLCEIDVRGGVFDCAGEPKAVTVEIANTVEAEWLSYASHARAVIEAMLEPNEDMAHAGADAECIEEHWIGLTTARTCWRAMISAALGEKPE